MCHVSCLFMCAFFSSSFQFYKWAGNHLAAVAPTDCTCSYYYLSPEWVYAFIKSANKEDSASLLATNLHPLHMTLPWAVSLPQHNITCSNVPAEKDKPPAGTGAGGGGGGGYYARRQVQRDSQDQDSQDREENFSASLPPTPRKGGGGGRYACMIDSNPELNPTTTSRGGAGGSNHETETVMKKKQNLNAHITDKFKELQKIYEMVGVCTCTLYKVDGSALFPYCTPVCTCIMQAITLFCICFI
jgi:hypothetical protein